LRSRDNAKSRRFAIPRSNTGEMIGQGANTDCNHVQIVHPRRESHLRQS